MTQTPVRLASSVLLIRQGVDGIEILMVLRPPRGFFGGLAAFPGGALDDGDVLLAGRPGFKADVDGHHVAAIRELGEEVGLVPVDGRGVKVSGEAFLESVSRAGESMTLISRWVTPEFAPVRFDTRFFLVPVAECDDVVLNEAELAGFEWTTAAGALKRHQEGKWKMLLPTTSHLSWLSRWDTTAQAVTAAGDVDGLTIICPVKAADGSLVHVYLPDESV